MHIKEKNIFVNIIINKLNTVGRRYTFSTIPITHILQLVQRFIQSTHPSYTKSLNIKATDTTYIILFNVYEYRERYILGFMKM